MQTDQLRRLEYAKVDPTDQVVKLFVGIYGVGFEKAKAWAAAGHRTLDDILSKEKLSDSQRIGVEHYEGFNTRMPRDEVQKHGQIIIDRAKDIDNKLQLQIMGSYRRVSVLGSLVKQTLLTSTRVQRLAEMYVLVHSSRFSLGDLLDANNM